MQFRFKIGITYVLMQWTFSLSANRCFITIVSNQEFVKLNMANFVQHCSYLLDIEFPEIHPLLDQIHGNFEHDSVTKFLQSIYIHDCLN